MALLLLVLLALVSEVGSARAQETAEPAPSPWKTAAMGAAGALSGFVLHEAGHLSADLMLGNVPHFEGMMVGGVIPFFAIAPDIRCVRDACTMRDGRAFKPGRHGEIYIVTAGFTVQHLTDEILLGVAPQLAYEYAPFRKGLLGFNILLSVVYAAAAYTGVEDQHGDVHGVARRLAVPDRWIATVLLLPAALDAYRYFFPYASWATWASRISKASLFGVSFVF